MEVNGKGETKIGLSSCKKSIEIRIGDFRLCCWCDINQGLPEYYVSPGRENMLPGDRQENRVNYCFNCLCAFWVL